MPLQAETNEYKAPSRLPTTHITPDPNTLISSPSPPIPSSQLYPSAPIHRTQPPHPNFRSGSYIIQLQTHPIMNLIVRKLDMILIRSIPFLKNYLAPICAGLCCDHFLHPSASRPSTLDPRKTGEVEGGSGGGTRGGTLRVSTVSSESTFTRTFFPRRSFAMTSIITILNSSLSRSARSIANGIQPRHTLKSGF